MATPLVKSPVPGYVTGKWQIDPAHSQVSFTVRYLMFTKVHGRFTEFTGGVVAADDPTQSTVSVTIDAGSFSTANDQRDAHVKSPDFLDVANFPEITYTSTAVRVLDDGMAIEGDLTIRGVTRPVTLAVDSHGVGQGAMGETRAGFSATTEIDKTDFGVAFNAPLPGGGALLSDKVQLSIDVSLVLDQG